MRPLAASKIPLGRAACKRQMKKSGSSKAYENDNSLPDCNKMNRRHFVKSLGASTAIGALSHASGAGWRARKGGDDEELVPNPIWPRSVMVPIPEATAGVASPSLSLNGIWKFTLRPPARFWSNEVDPSNWDDIEVPGECTMQGFQIARDTEYPFKTSVSIPSDFERKRIFLRFDGLYSHGRVWVNGHYVRDHRGGFTSWDCEITPFVTAGEKAWITVGVTDESDSISWQSNYAKHYIGGILRDVKLFAVPADYVTRVHVETELDSTFDNAVLRVTASMAFDRARHATLELNLKDPDGNNVLIQPAMLRLSRRASEGVVSVPVARPAKWDCEHPRLYELEAALKLSGSTGETLTRKFGFRKVEVHGNQVYVNGDPVKLHGGCRHDVYPTRGRSTTPTLDEEDVNLLKNANFKFVRTSHYPPSQSFLDSCDRHGLYVEEETAACFVGTQSEDAENDPHYTPQFMNQFAEMIERDRDHPSVILWSLGNESRWGPNFAKEYSFMKIEDPTRPVIFSYPDTVPKGVKAYDVYSEHYPKSSSDFTSVSRPKLNDEFGHISCYNQQTLRRDPGVRNYWGRSIKEFWEGMFRASGCLGGSIWASIDEVFMLPHACVGYGEWGIIDGWRREKPEYWLAKKAYSPARILDGYVENPGAGNPLKIPIGNEFDHTNLNEITIEWSVGSERGQIRDLNVAPHAAGLLVLPARAWRNGDIVSIKFEDREGRLLDEYALPVGKEAWHFPTVHGPAPRVDEGIDSVRVSGEQFEINFSKVSGLIRDASYKGHRILEGGPILNLAPFTLRDWWLYSLKTTQTPAEAVIEILGYYQSPGRSSEIDIQAQYQLRIDGGGLITTNFKIQGIPRNAHEIGVAYILPRETDQLSWSRKALWSVYPADHIGRRSGVAHKIRPAGSAEEDRYRVSPSWAWSEDMKDFFLFGKDDSGGRGTQDFRSQKENIWFASGILSQTGVRARAESEATHAVRAEIQGDGRVRLNVNSAWAYPDLDWGNDCPPLPASDVYEGSVRLRLTDNDSVQRSFTESR